MHKPLNFARLYVTILTFLAIFWFFLSKAITLDATNYKAFVFAGNASFHLEKVGRLEGATFITLSFGQYQRSEKMYTQATKIKPDVPLAWKGLLELFSHSLNYGKSIAVLKKLIELTTGYTSALNNSPSIRSNYFCFQGRKSALILNSNFAKCCMLICSTNWCSSSWRILGDWGLNSPFKILRCSAYWSQTNC